MSQIFNLFLSSFFLKSSWFQSWLNSVTRLFFPSSWLPVLSPQFHFKHIFLSTQRIAWGISCSLTALCCDTRVPTKTRNSVETLVSTASLNLSSFLGWPRLLLSEQDSLSLYSDLQGHHPKSSRGRLNAEYPYKVKSMVVTMSLNLPQFWSKSFCFFPTPCEDTNRMVGLISVLKEVSIYSH